MVRIDVGCHTAIEKKFSGKCVELQQLYRVRVPKLRKNKATKLFHMWILALNLLFCMFNYEYLSKPGN